MRQDSQSHLEFLEHGNLFLTALDEQHEWYRYHNLFQLLLQQQLQKRHSSLIPSLHLRASEWYEQIKRDPQAIHHAFKSQDLDRSAELIERAADATLLNGEVNTFLNWFENLPEDICCQWPLLCVYHAEALLLAGKSMSHITQRLEDTNEITAIEALKASYQGNVNLSKKLSAQALENLPKYSVFLRSVIISSLGAVLLLSGDIGLAINTFIESAAINKENYNLMFEVIALSRLGQLYKIKGELNRAEKIIHQALELSTIHSGDFIPVASMPLKTLANLKYEMNDLEFAHSLIEKAIELSEESGGFWLIDCCLVSAFVQLGMGEIVAARKVMV
jgi:LuxR family maltose regulon positive regulatory protein